MLNLGHPAPADAFDLLIRENTFLQHFQGTGMDALRKIAILGLA